MGATERGEGKKCLQGQSVFFSTLILLNFEILHLLLLLLLKPILLKVNLVELQIRQSIREGGGGGAGLVVGVLLDLGNNLLAAGLDTGVCHGGLLVVLAVLWQLQTQRAPSASTRTHRYRHAQKQQQRKAHIRTTEFPDLALGSHLLDDLLLGAVVLLLTDGLQFCEARLGSVQNQEAVL